MAGISRVVVVLLPSTLRSTGLDPLSRFVDVKFGIRDRMTSRGPTMKTHLSVVMVDSGE